MKKFFTRQTRPTFRPRLEALEVRDVPAAGALDPAFGSGGVVIDDLSPGKDLGVGVIVQASGKIVVGGMITNSKGGRDSVLRRYLPNGSLDTTFCTNGMTTIDFKGGWDDGGLGLAVQPDGKIIGATSSYNPQDWTFPYDARYGIARFTPDGALDKSFGTQGKVVIDYSTGADIISGLALQADGKLVVSGSTNGFAGGDNAFVARFNASGSVDTTFGGSKGYVVTDFGGSDGSSGLTIQGDGRIVAVGHADLPATGYRAQVAIARYNTNGTLDSTFGSGGKLLGDFGSARDVLIQPDGRIVVAGDNFVARYLSAAGALDPSFGSSGVVTLVGGGESLKAQPDGKLVVGGHEGFWEILPDGTGTSSSKFSVTRMSGVDGSLDVTFGDGGRASTYITDPGKGSDCQLNDIAIQPDGRIVGAGYVSITAPGRSSSLALVRYLGDAPLLAAGRPKHASPQAITSAQVQPLLAEAIARWQAVGGDTSLLHGIDILIADLGGTTLGLASGHTITLDDNAAGWSWFVDHTPNSDSEFTTPGNQGEQNRMDLLTVLEHEVGHLLGYEHEESGVMIDTLPAGTRRGPGNGIDSATRLDGRDLFLAFLDADGESAWIGSSAFGRGRAKR